MVGTEEVWSRCVAEIAKDAVKASSCEVVGESYLPMVGGDVDAAGRGDPGRQAGRGPEHAGGRLQRPVLLGDAASEAVGREAPGDGVQRRRGRAEADPARRRRPVITRPGATSRASTAPRAANSSASSRRSTARIGPVSDSMVAAYNGVMIWAQAADEAEHGRRRRRSSNTSTARASTLPRGSSRSTRSREWPGDRASSAEPGPTAVRRRLVDLQANPSRDLRSAPGRRPSGMRCSTS